MSNNKQIEIVKVEKSISNDFVGYKTLAIEEYFEVNAIDGEKALSYSFLMDSFRKLMGKTLTIIDASIQDKVQNKAIKDLVRNVFSDEIEFSSKFAFDQDKLTSLANQSVENLSDDEIARSSVDIEDMLGVERN